MEFHKVASNCHVLGITASASQHSDVTSLGHDHGATFWLPFLNELGSRPVLWNYHLVCTQAEEWFLHKSQLKIH